MGVTVVDTKEEFTAHLENAGDKLVVVDFYASWCPPCKHIAPKIEEFSNKYTNAIFLKVDVDNNSEVAEEYEISAMPTFLYFKKKAVVDTIVGASEQCIETAIGKNL